MPRKTSPPPQNIVKVNFALVKAGAVLHGSQANTAFLGLHVTVRADQAQVVDVEAEVSPVEEPTE